MEQRLVRKFSLMEVVMDDYNDYSSMSNIELLEEVARRLREEEPSYRDKIVWTLTSSNGARPPKHLEPSPAPAQGTSITEAASIMGRWYVPIEEAQRRLGIHLSTRVEEKGWWLWPTTVPSERDRVMARLHVVPFSRERLENCRDTHVLLPSFPESIRLRLDNAYIPWGVEWSRSGEFAKAISPRACMPVDSWGWHLVRRNCLPESVGLHWSEQRIMVPAEEYVPPAALVVYASVVVYRALGETLYQTPARCCDVLQLENAIVYGEQGKVTLTREYNPYTGKLVQSLAPGVATAVKPLVLE